MNQTKRERLRPAMSPNGKKVHLASWAGHPICGADIEALHPVRGRITCPSCRRRRPRKARALDTLPLIIGLNWEPLYRALGRALDGECTEEEFTGLARGGVKVPYWPVLAAPDHSTAPTKPTAGSAFR